MSTGRTFYSGMSRQAIISESIILVISEKGGANDKSRDSRFENITQLKEAIADKKYYKDIYGKLLEIKKCKGGED